MGYDLETGESTRKISDIEVLTDVLLFFTEEKRRRPLMRQEVGYIESIILDGMEENPIRAKFDTGNSASATMLHVDNMEIKGDTVIWQKNGNRGQSDGIFSITRRRN
jgi:hypothetical protein